LDMPIEFTRGIVENPSVADRMEARMKAEGQLYCSFSYRILIDRVSSRVLIRVVGRPRVNTYFNYFLKIE